MPLSEPQLRGFIRALPKTETHLHLEGSLSYELLHDWDPQKYPLNPAWRSPEHRFESFQKFDETLLGHALPWFNSPERYYEAARVTFARHVEQNVRYVETSFHLGIVEFVKFGALEIIAAIRAAVPPGLEVRIFAGMLRSNYAGPVRPLIDDLENWDDLAGVDLHGFERVVTEPWSAPLWRRLGDAGKITKCHAGEFDGAHRVREAIEELGVSRVQHGVRAIEDPAVVQLAADRNVTFDVCPISNVKLQVYPDLRRHPLRALAEAGVRCTISSDDPLAFGNQVTDDYLALGLEADYTMAELAGFARSGWEVAAVAPEVRDRNLAEIARVTKAFADV